MQSTAVQLWVQKKKTYVEVAPVVLRLKHPSKFGLGKRGLKDVDGNLCEVETSALVALRPIVVEVSDSVALSEFLTVLEFSGDGHKCELLNHILLLSFHDFSISVQNLKRLLLSVNLLAAFSVVDAYLTNDEWREILPRLSQVSLRAIDISSNAFDDVLQSTDVELVRFCGGPGASADALQATSSNYVTVRAVIMQELCFTNESDAEKVLDVMTQRFPRLKTLVWDWNMVDPALAFDARTETIVVKLSTLYRESRLSSLAIVAYTPCEDTKRACSEVARLLIQSISNVQIFHFASKGTSSDMPNFSFIVAGEDTATVSALHQIYVQDRNSNPDLRHFLKLCDLSCPSLSHSTIAEFGGLNNQLVRNQYESQKT